DYKNSTRTFTKTISTWDGRPPNRPTDYVILKIGASGTIIWEDSGKDTLKMGVPDNGKIEAKLKATKELAPLTVQRVVITAEYFADSTSTTPWKLKDTDIIIANQKLHGRVYDIGAAAVGRADDTVEGKATEMFIGMIPIVGNAGAIVGEVINAFDPDAE